MLQHLSVTTDVQILCPTFVAKAATDVAKAVISSENPAVELPLAAGLSSVQRVRSGIEVTANAADH